MKFTLGQIKLYMSQCGRSRLWGDAARNLTLPRRLLKGLHYCHKNNILHRDIKGSSTFCDASVTVATACVSPLILLFASQTS